MGYTGIAIKGISWIAALRGSARFITIIRTAILARLLSPVEFGIFGIASLFLTLLEILTETGINIFLVQEKKDLKQYVNSAWVVSIARGVILAIAILISSPFIANFFNSPQSLLIIQMIAIVPFIRGFINPAIIIFQKELQFGNEFWFRFSLILINSFVAILAAFIFRNAASFVFGLIADVVLEVALSFILVKLRPNLHFEIKKVEEIFHKGKWVTLLGIFSYFSKEGDSIAVGKLLGTANLGFYSVAYKFSTLPLSEITDVINRVVFPVYTKFSDDKKRLWRAFIKTSLVNHLTALMFGIILFLFAKGIILLLLGNTWISMVPIIKILAIYGVLRAIFGSFSPLFLSVGRQDYVASMTFVRVLGLAITIVPFIMAYGIIGAGYSAIVSILVEIPVIVFFTYKIFKI